MLIDKILIPLLKLKIWQHQKDATKEILKYLESYNDKAFLVKMPTGTGKTGVFACLSRVAKPDFNYIIITPSTALKKQIVTELRISFWDKIGYDKSNLQDQQIEDLLPSNVNDVLESISGKKFIVVTTIQTLQTLSASPKYESEIDELRRITDCLVFDEGHKEPAFTWGETVRSFKKPTILFSATPYRNDYKIFNIDKDSFYSLEHKFCEQNNYLRKLEIRQLNLTSFGPATFVNALLSEISSCQKVMENQGIKEPKVIIRCAKDRDITQIVSVLLKLKKKVIGIHENFKVQTAYTNEVPVQTEQHKYQFYVHQYKLIEGIDNPEFCMVALYDDFSNARLLIQQVGRVLRNTKLASSQVAFLFSLNIAKHKEDWRKYLEYDELMNKRRKLFDITDVLKVNKEASTLYFSGTFRELIDVNNIDLSKSLLFQKKVNVLFHDNKIDFDLVSKRLLDEWSKRDYYVLKHDVVNSNILLILYIKYENSPLVKDEIFIEQTLALTFMSFMKDYIFYYDSEQNNPMFAMEDVEPISRETLVNMLSAKKNIVKVFLHNTDIGSNSLRSKEIQAASVEATAPGLSDFSFFPTRMEANVADKGEQRRRYIGFQFGRVTDFSSKRIPLPEYIDWINSVNAQLRTAASSNISAFMKRFSIKVDPPTNPKPVSILLDIDQSVFLNFNFRLEEVEFEDLSATILGDKFNIKIKGISYNFSIKYIKETKKYSLECEELDRDITNTDPEGLTLTGYLNVNQSFRIIIQGNRYVYAYKNFFKPGANLISKKKELDLRQLFHVHPVVSNIKSEKGSAVMPVSGKHWHRNTLFGLVSRLGKGYGDKQLEALLELEHLICDDLANEIADFIGIDTKSKRLVLIHAKAGKSKLSASAFTEVCGQAVKNLDYLSPYYQTDPARNIQRWQGKWTLNKIGSLDRILHGGATARTFWSQYAKLIADPSCVREVWMIVGNLFDYNSFERELNKTKIENVAPEVIQLIYLLRSTWNSVSSVGAQLKIIC
jgi:superfamily II DNA or RNA helicase